MQVSPHIDILATRKKTADFSDKLAGLIDLDIKNIDPDQAELIKRCICFNAFIQTTRYFQHEAASLIALRKG